MKRWLFILGIIIILILIGIWIFLLFASDETKNDIFNTFGFSGSEEEGFDVPGDWILPELEPEQQRLRQLSTRRVIGHAELAGTSTPPVVLSVEMGTGHVFKINPLTLEEERISNTTIRNASFATVSPLGTAVAIITGQGGGALEVLYLTTAEVFTISETVLEAAFTTDGTEILYLARADGAVLARAFNLELKTSRTLFSLPFRSATMIWGETAASAHHFYPKTSRQLEGYLYRTQGTSFTRLPISGFGLSARGNESHILYNQVTDNRYATYLVDTTTSIVQILSTNLFAEKCGFNDVIIVCGEGAELSNSEFPDNWYRGEISFNNRLWSINPTTSEANELDNLRELSGQDIDATQFGINETAERVYFVNKNDSSLWVYDIPRVNQ